MMPLEIPCPKCGGAQPCPCVPLPPGPKMRSEVLKLRREKRPGGREMTIIEGFLTGSVDVEALGRELKRKCGTGGSVDGGRIELQGDQRDVAAAFLLEKGFKSKRAGG